MSYASKEASCLLRIFKGNKELVSEPRRRWVRRFKYLPQQGRRVLSPRECERKGGARAGELAAETPGGQRCPPKASLGAYLLRIFHVEFSWGDPLFREHLHHGAVEARAVGAVRRPHDL